MKLVIKPHEMQIVTETVQDVAYLKNMGYYDDNQDIHLKVGVVRTLDRTNSEEGAEINICWEDADSGYLDGSGNLISREQVQFISGPKTSKEHI